jgi:hypothetical protein
MMNYTHILLRTTHCGIHLNVTNSNCFLLTPVRLLTFKEFTWMRESKSLWSVWKIILSPLVQGLLLLGDFQCTLRYIISTSCFPCILGSSQPDNYFLCRLLTWYSEVKDFCSNDLSPLSEDFLNGPHCEFHDCQQGLECVHYTELSL